MFARRFPYSPMAEPLLGDGTVLPGGCADDEAILLLVADLFSRIYPTGTYILIVDPPSLTVRKVLPEELQDRRYLGG
jgi:hypothetical protein